MNTTESLKVGDQAAIRRGYYGAYELHAISKVTPSGQVVLDDGSRYKDGIEMGGHSSWNKGCLYVVTPDILLAIKRRDLESQLKDLADSRRINRLNDDALDELLAVLKKHGGE